MARNNRRNYRDNRSENNRVNSRGRNRQPEVREGEATMILEGYIRDASDNFPITFKYNDNELACFYGATIEAPVKMQNSDDFYRTFMSVVAFGEPAEDLADVESGDWVRVEGRYQTRKGSDGKYYPQVVIEEVLDVEQLS